MNTSWDFNGIKCLFLGTKKNKQRIKQKMDIVPYMRQREILCTY